jgi:hypothetical protein
MVNVKVYSLLGNELINERWQTETGNNIRSLNLSSQPEGIYFVRIESGNNRAVVKLLKQ